MKRCDGIDCKKSRECIHVKKFLEDGLEKAEEPDADWMVFKDDERAVIFCRDFKGENNESKTR